MVTGGCVVGWFAGNCRDWLELDSGFFCLFASWQCLATSPITWTAGSDLGTAIRPAGFQDSSALSKEWMVSKRDVPSYPPNNKKCELINKIFDSRNCSHQICRQHCSQSQLAALLLEKEVWPWWESSTIDHQFSWSQWSPAWFLFLLGSAYPL